MAKNDLIMIGAIGLAGVLLWSKLKSGVNDAVGGAAGAFISNSSERVESYFKQGADNVYEYVIKEVKDNPFSPGGLDDKSDKAVNDASAGASWAWNKYTDVLKKDLFYGPKLGLTVMGGALGGPVAVGTARRITLNMRGAADAYVSSKQAPVNVPTDRQKAGLSYMNALKDSGNQVVNHDLVNRYQTMATRFKL